jgi:hypothetical protein
MLHQAQHYVRHEVRPAAWNRSDRQLPVTSPARMGQFKPN